MFDRFIVLGDSFSEGLCDEQYTPDNFRGWADRVAENLATLNSEFTYVNLAIRGKLLHQVAQAHRYHWIGTPLEKDFWTKCCLGII